MQAFIISAMYKLVKVLFAKGDVVTNIKELVLAVTDSTLEGPEKKVLVLKELREIGGSVGEAIAEVSSIVLSMAVDIVVAYLESKGAIK